VQTEVPRRPHPVATGRKLALAAYLGIVGVGAFLSWLPQPPVQPLVAPDGWLSEGFERTDQRATASEARRALREGTSAVYWRAWPRSGDERIHRLKSADFATPDVLLLPYMLQDLAETLLPLRQVERDVAVHLECVETGSRLRLARRKTNVRFSELLVDVPSGFCTGSSRLIVVTRFPFYLNVGTPHAVSRLALLQESAFVHAFRHAVIFGLLVLLGGSPVLVARSCGIMTRAPALFLLGLGLSGYAAFFIFFASVAAGRVASVGLVCVAAVAGALCIRRQPELGRKTVLQLAPALGAWFAGSLFYVLLLHALDSGAGSWHPNNRFWPVRWSSDNVLSLWIGEALIEGRPLQGLLGPQWQVSDRPPLQTGIATLLRPLSPLFLVGRGEGQHVAWFHHTVGILVNSLWLLACAELCHAIGLARRAGYAVLIVLATTPLAIFNSIYVWPKMLAGAYGIAALTPLLSGGFGDRAPRSLYRCLPLSSCLGALSLLSHGGGVSFFAAAGVWAVARIGVPQLRHLLPALALAAILLSPWILWQRWVDPPGTALIKSALTDTYGFEERDVGVLETVRRTYAATSLDEWLGIKRWALQQLLVGGPETDWGSWSWFERRRLKDFFHVGPSVGILFVSILAVLLRRKPRPTFPPWTYAHCRALIVIGVLGTFISWLVFLPRPFLHRQAYAGLLVMLLGGIAGSIGALGATGFAIWGAVFVYGTVTWIVEPAFQGDRIDPLGVALCGLGLALAGCHLFGFRERFMARRPD